MTYTRTGTIAQFVQKSEAMIGIESVPEAIGDAKEKLPPIMESKIALFILAT